MTVSSSNVYPEEVNMDNCAREPIHIIGKCQSHGVILACNVDDLTVTQCSENTGSLFSIPHNDLLGKKLSHLTGPALQEQLQKSINAGSEFYPEEINLGGNKFLMLPHLSEETLLLDFEPLPDLHEPIVFQRQLTQILNSLRSAGSVKDLCRKVAFLTKELFEYDRVMVYRFDKEWNGEVVAEEKLKDAASWLGLHYPATDIPAQSRALFLKNRIRIIANVHDKPVPISPVISPLNDLPLDLSKSGLRGVSPIHLEYLENMGVGASLTAAIIVEGKLWGLLTCHHNSAKFINYYQRESCRLLVQIFSNELSLRETNSFLEKSAAAEEKREKLVLQMEPKNGLFEALTSEIKFTDLISCTGGVLFVDDEAHGIGNVPSKKHIYELISRFLHEKKENLYATSRFSEEFEPAQEYRETASGILSLRISENDYIIWFRPEVIQTVTWGGNPNKKGSYNEEKQRISPRKSFEKWSEQVRGTSEEWEEADRNVVKALGENISYFLLERQKNEINALNKRLTEANKELELFNFGLSHDLRAPLRGMNGYLEILQEDYGSKLGEEGLSILGTTLEQADKMNLLIDDILSYSRMNSEEITTVEVSVNKLVKDILEVINPGTTYPESTIVVQDKMPPVQGDRRMLFQLWANLINNALVYSSKQEKPRVEVGCLQKEQKNVYFVRDNGIGIAPEYQEKIFSTFTRLAGKEYKGSGIGLAIVKLVAEKHLGKIWVESEAGKGAAFFFEI